MNEPTETLPEGSLVSHLMELRDRLLHSIIAVLVIFLPCAYFANPLFDFIAKPLLRELPKDSKLIATGVTSGFMAPFKLSFFVALFIAIPYVLYQTWAFVAPGLYRREKRFAIPLLISSVVLFYVGAVFAYEFVFPVMFAFFVNTTPVGVTMMTDISEYLGFVLVMLFAFGVAFEIPIVVVLAIQTGLVTIEKLKKNRGYVLIAAFVVAAVLTPPDAVSQTLMAVPMYLLYEGGLIMGRILLAVRREE